MKSAPEAASKPQVNPCVANSGLLNSYEAFNHPHRPRRKNWARLAQCQEGERSLRT